jgi:phage baseplate assembly protein W
MSININRVGAATPVDSVSKIQYRDLYLDLAENTKPSNNASYGKLTQTDIHASVDEGCIMNSLTNLFNTVPGQKILNPEFGINLMQWLFEPVSEFTAREIGEAIQFGITKFEPRVQLTHVSVISDQEKNQYIIKLAIQIPSLNISTTYDAALNQFGFEFLTENE